MKVKYKVYINNIELFFDSKPDPAIRDSLKSAGWKWIDKYKCWRNTNTSANLRFAQSLYEEYSNIQSSKRNSFGDELKRVVCNYTNYFPEDFYLGSFPGNVCCKGINLIYDSKLIRISTGDYSMNIGGYFCPRCHRICVTKHEINKKNNSNNYELLYLPFKMVEVNYYKKGIQYNIEPIKNLVNKTYKELYNKNFRLFIIMRSYIFNKDIELVCKILKKYGVSLDQINDSLINEKMNDELVDLFDVSGIEDLCHISISDLLDGIHRIISTAYLEKVYSEIINKEDIRHIVFKYNVSKDMIILFKLPYSRSMTISGIKKYDFSSNKIIICFQCSKSKNKYTYPLIDDDAGYKLLLNKEKYIQFCNTKTKESVDTSDVNVKLLKVADFLVRSSTYGCVNNKHQLIRINAAIKIKNTNGIYEVQVPAAYCSKCNKYYILEKYYNELKKYGYICCKIDTFETIQKNYGSGFSSFQDKSILTLYGYSVDKQKDIPEGERHSILDFVIDNGIQNKYQVISHLENNINLRKHNYIYKDAIIKWENDIDYVRKKQKIKAVVRVDSIKVPIKKIILK